MRRVSVLSAASLRQCRCFNVNKSTQTKWNVEQQEASQKRTDYDFDREQWMKQMKFASMDCIMDPSISPIRYNSLAGIKKALQRWVTMKKLIERRPEFSLENLKSLFVEYKRISHSHSLEDAKLLQRLTTHTETTRISREIQQKLNDEFAKKSWKSLKISEQTNGFEMEVDDFVLVNCYMGQMSQEDWLQITVRCDFRQRLDATKEWEKVTEYPVFEVRLGDGVKSANTHRFIVVGVLRKDGTRYGKDAQDAATLRKQFDRSKSWF